jgi:hypothetical protein
MPIEAGREIALGAGRELTPGTTVAPGFWIKTLDQGFKERADKEVNESSLNVLDAENDSEVMATYGQGPIGGKVGDRTIGLLLAWFAGAAPVTTDNADTDASVKDHTITPAQLSEPMSLTLALKDKNRDQRFPMARPASWNLNIEAGQWAKWSAEAISKAPTNGAGNTVIYTAENEFKYKHASVKLAANVAGLAGATAIPLRVFNWNGEQSLNRYQALGSNDPHGIYLQEKRNNGDFALLFDSLTHRDAYLNGTQQVMQLILENSDVTIGAAARPKVVITFYKVKLDDWDLEQGLGSMVEQTLGFKPFYSLSDGKVWDAVVTNTVASY